MQLVGKKALTDIQRTKPQLVLFCQRKQAEVAVFGM